MITLLILPKGSMMKAWSRNRMIPARLTPYPPPTSCSSYPSVSEYFMSWWCKRTVLSPSLHCLATDFYGYLWPASIDFDRHLSSLIPLLPARILQSWINVCELQCICHSSPVHIGLHVGTLSAWMRVNTMLLVYGKWLLLVCNNAKTAVFFSYSTSIAFDGLLIAF